MKSARDLFVAVMGAWMGLAGVEHGVGEILQGNVAPEGIMIRSWPDSAFFASLSGEPAMTIVPNMLLTGVLAVVFSLLFAGWAILGAARKHGGVILMLLALPMLLCGGGVFPPVLGLLIGLAAAGRRPDGAKKPASNLHRLLGRGWPWVFSACCLAWLALFPGVAMLSYFFGIDQVGVILPIMAAAFSLLLLAHRSSVEHDRLLSVSRAEMIEPGKTVR